VWPFHGYDEINYTTTPEGAALLGAIAAAHVAPVHVRSHFLFNTGDGTPAMKWGSTNVYTEDANGRPIYDWTILDRIIDTYRAGKARKIVPLFQLGFMPEALSSHPQPYRHFWKPGDNYNDIYTGWSYPPADYDKSVKHPAVRLGSYPDLDTDPPEVALVLVSRSAPSLAEADSWLRNELASP